MTSTKHTPGPWITNRHDHDSPFTVISSNGEWVCKVSSEGNWAGQTNEKEKANARLIAAAPDMLEALTKLRDSAKGLSGSDQEWIVADAIELANAAIVLALGTDSSEVEG